MPNTKIATCCYCGTRAALVLKGQDRHELACSSCGAPLHEMKMLRQDSTGPRELAAGGKKAVSSYRPGYKSSYKKKSKKRRKGFKDFLLDEVWDTIEDIFD